MAGGFTAINLEQLPKPDIIDELDYETILASIKAELIAKDPDLSDILDLESEPLTKLAEVCALRELLLRNRINDAAHGVMLAYAVGNDLDNLGALFGVLRLVLDPGDPEANPVIDPTYEDDSDYRRRIQLALEGFSTAGPEGAYIFHALSADGDVLDASATSPTPGDVLVTVLSRTGDGTANQTLRDTVEAVVSAEDVRPLTDNVTVQSASIQNYSVAATLYFYNGPDPDVVLAASQAAIDTYVDEHHKLGLDITLSGIYAALHQPGVQRVVLASPATNLTIDRQTAAYCTGITLTNGGYDE